MARISYLDPATIDDPEIQAMFETARRVGTPRPEGLAIKAHLPEPLKLWIRLRQRIYREGVLDHGLKELTRVRVTQLVDCYY